MATQGDLMPPNPQMSDLLALLQEAAAMLEEQEFLMAQEHGNGEVAPEADGIVLARRLRDAVDAARAT